MEILHQEHLDFLLGGAYAFAWYTGIERNTKDLDLFIRRADYPRVEQVLNAAGHRTELTYPHWLAKSFHGDAFVDLIFNSGNGIAPVDSGWFGHAAEAQVLGVPVKIAPVEETLCSKAFIMERERYDGADIAHLLRAQAAGIDWERLLRRFGLHWRVLLAHLVQFGFIYPAERSRIPTWLMDDLIDRLRQETWQPPVASQVCAGTLLSREQYLYDVEQLGYLDARLAPLGTMTLQDLAHWTRAIAGRTPPPSGE
ncbi:MAG TPA: nucleotidyltransferase family protein [Albitalea sp.]|uniref:nucleotidyltransferase family protein n=1 Tax=Piscinibacter sp. TaxID=1903157 RepID=UPI002ED4E990